MKKEHKKPMGKLGLRFLFGLMVFSGLISLAVSVEAKSKVVSFEICCKQQLGQGKTYEQATSHCSSQNKSWKKNICLTPVSKEFDFADTDLESDDEFVDVEDDTPAI